MLCIGEGMSIVKKQAGPDLIDLEGNDELALCSLGDGLSEGLQLLVIHCLTWHLTCQLDQVIIHPAG